MPKSYVFCEHHSWMFIALLPCHNTTKNDAIPQTFHLQTEQFSYGLVILVITHVNVRNLKITQMDNSCFLWNIVYYTVDDLSVHAVIFSINVPLWSLTKKISPSTMTSFLFMTDVLVHTGDCIDCSMVWLLTIQSISEGRNQVSSRIRHNSSVRCWIIQNNDTLLFHIYERNSKKVHALGKNRNTNSLTFS